MEENANNNTSTAEIEETSNNNSITSIKSLQNFGKINQTAMDDNDDLKMFEVIGDTLYHDSLHFTQGLTYSKWTDTLYESCGLYKKSKLCKLNATTGHVLTCRRMAPEYFA